MTAVDVVEDTADAPDVEAAAQDALIGSPSTPEGVNHAFVTVAQLLGYDAWEVVDDHGQPLATINVDGEELTLNIAQGEYGVYPWQYDEAGAEDTEEAEQTEDEVPSYPEESEESGEEAPDQELQDIEPESSEDQEVLPQESLSINDATVATIANKTYTGSAIKPAPVVTLDGYTLVSGMDYTVSYANNTKVGTTTITITGTGSYSGSLTATFTIVKASISKATVAAIAKRAYTGKAQQPAPKVTFGGKTLKKDTDYTLSYKNNTKAGKATCTIKGKGNFTGQKTVTFQIVNPSIAYCTHVQKDGWQSWRRNGSMSGTSGRALRLEGIKIKLEGSRFSGGIQYRTHVQKIGWQGWRKDGVMSGTSGRSLRLEAIQIKLYGEMANIYDVYYRVHAQHMGWMTWAKNGANSGTAGFAGV